MGIDSFKFWDIVELWGREKLEHEIVTSRKLAVGIVKDGLRFQSTNPKWLKSSEEFLSYPYIGYVAHPGDEPIVLKAEVLEHLLSVASNKVEASRQLLQNEVVTKYDFKAWLVKTGQSFPEFWFKDEQTRNTLINK